MSAKRGCQVVGKRSKENNISKSRSAELVGLLIGISFIRHKGEDNNIKSLLSFHSLQLPIFLLLTVIMTTGVKLRQWRREDAAQLAAIANNKKIWLNVRDRFPHPYTIADALQWIAFCNTQNLLQNFAIEIDRQIAGSIGIITKEDVYRKSIEIGYFIGELFWSKGIATKAVGLLMEYLVKEHDPIRVWAEVFEHNTASMRVLEKNGFVLESIRQKSVFKNNCVLNDHVWVRLLK